LVSCLKLVSHKQEVREERAEGNVRNEEAERNKRMQTKRQRETRGWTLRGREKQEDAH